MNNPKFIENIRFDYNLTQKSLCFDVGGYRGDWAIEMLARYNCRVWIFEPIADFYKEIAGRFKKNPKIKVLDTGLSHKTEVTAVCRSEDNSSAYINTGNPETVRMRSLDNILQAYPEVQHIDVMKINIEGGEYDLLNNIIDAGLIEMIDNLQIQFHKFGSSPNKKREQICNKLKDTHIQTWNYDWIWENWEIL